MLCEGVCVERLCGGVCVCGDVCGEGRVFGGVWGAGFVCK